MCAVNEDRSESPGTELRVSSSSLLRIPDTGAGVDSDIFVVFSEGWRGLESGNEGFLLLSSIDRIKFQVSRQMFSWSPWQWIPKVWSAESCDSPAASVVQVVRLGLKIPRYLGA